MVHRVSKERRRVSEMVIFASHSNDLRSIFLSNRREFGDMLCNHMRLQSRKYNTLLCGDALVTLRQKFRSSRPEELPHEPVCCFGQGFYCEALVNMLSHHRSSNYAIQQHCIGKACNQME